MQRVILTAALLGGIAGCGGKAPPSVTEPCPLNKLNYYELTFLMEAQERLLTEADEELSSYRRRALDMEVRANLEDNPTDKARTKKMATDLKAIEDNCRAIVRMRRERLEIIFKTRRIVWEQTKPDSVWLQTTYTPLEAADQAEKEKHIAAWKQTAPDKNPAP